jgi:hypothetical protein
MFVHEISIYQFLLDYGRDLTKDLAPEQFSEQPIAGMNHPAWILGHLTFVAQFGVTLCGGEGWLDEAWNEKFGIGSQPSNDPNLYPSPQELFASYEDGHTRLTQAARSLDQAHMDKPTEIEALRSIFPTHGMLLAHILTSHEATHLGQLSAWRRAMALDSVRF